jgi:hypothetical protein
MQEAQQQRQGWRLSTWRLHWGQNHWQAAQQTRETDAHLRCLLKLLQTSCFNRAIQSFLLGCPVLFPPSSF